MRLFTKAQKRHLYLMADGKCQNCGCELSTGWEAHHIKRWADGGHTELYNGMALCKACHKHIHGGLNMTIRPRGWQDEALQDFRTHSNLCFLADATPGAGKTFFSGFCAKEMISRNPNIFTIIVVPTTALKKGFLDTFNDLQIDITSTLKNGNSRPKEFQGGIVTYQQLPNIVSTFETWKRNGTKMFFVFDEIHHASETNVWGKATEDCGRLAEKILAMTGTPFRSDGQKISFLRYNHDGIVISDASYTYRQSVADNVCRQVFFVHDDGIAEWERNSEAQECKISEAKDRNVYDVANTIFRRGSSWIKETMSKADSKLEEYRSMFHNAGGIVICRPGGNEFDERHLHQMADLVRKETGESPVVISHDDRDADAKIERFRKSNQKWIVSVRKISEGVDIKRLRVMVILSKPNTELLFRQLVGRVVRVENLLPDVMEDATVFMAKFPELVGWASQIAEEAASGLDDREKEQSDGEGRREDTQSDFMALGCSHEHGGGTAINGEQFSFNEIDYAEQLKKNDPMLNSVSVGVLAHFIRKYEKTDIVVQPTIEKPLHERKKKKRNEINSLVRSIAYKLTPSGGKMNVAVKDVWKSTYKKMNVKNLDDLMDNHPIEKADLVVEYLKKYPVEKRGHAYA